MEFVEKVPFYPLAGPRSSPVSSSSPKPGGGSYPCSIPRCKSIKHRKENIPAGNWKESVCWCPASCPLGGQVFGMWMLSCFSHIWPFEILRTVARQAPLSMGFFRQEYLSGLPCPPPGDLPSPGIQPVSLMSLASAGEFFTTSTTWETPGLRCNLTVPQRVPRENETPFPTVVSSLYWLSILLCLTLPDPHFRGHLPSKLPASKFLS